MAASKSWTSGPGGGFDGAGWTVGGKELHFMDVAGADLRPKNGGRFAKPVIHKTAKDVRYSSAPSYSFGTRSMSAQNNFTGSNPMFWNGTHRANQGEVVLGTFDRRRNDDALKKMTSDGRQWKVTPGPGNYRIPRSFGTTVASPHEEVAQSVWQMQKSNSWKIPTACARGRTYHTLGGCGHDFERPEGGRPTPMNLSPGPGRYFQDVDGFPSSFHDLRRDVSG